MHTNSHIIDTLFLSLHHFKKDKKIKRVMFPHAKKQESYLDSLWRKEVVCNLEVAEIIRESIKDLSIIEAIQLTARRN